MNSTTVTGELTSEPAKQLDEDVPEGVKQVFDRVSLLFAGENRTKFVNIHPEPTDIFLCAGVKTGSTWLQHIMHGLRSRGDLNFDDINDVVFLSYSSENSEDLSKARVLTPRMFKTHQSKEYCPKGAAKYIVLLRNPKDVTVSAYWYFADRFFEKRLLGLNEYVDYFMAGRLEEFPNAPSSATHQASWYPHRKDCNVLWLHYEDMKSDLRQCIKLISDFLDIGVGDQKLLDLVEEQSSFEFMKKHESKFDDHKFGEFFAKLVREAGHKVLDGTGVKVRRGETNGWKEELSKEMAEAVDARWKSILKPISGYDSYEEMRAGVNAELGRSFAT